MSSFKPAQRRNAKLRLAISGTSGGGKTYSALLLSKDFGTKIAVLDSERGSAEKYAGEPDLPQFDHCNLEEKTIQEYLEKIKEAAEAGYEVLIIDSYSHSWVSALEAVDKMGGNKFSNGWKEISPLVRKLVDAILSYPGHVIATMRSKADFAVETVNGKATPKKVGMATVARDGTDYEFDVMIDLTPEGGLSISKTRCKALAGQLFTRDDVPKIGRLLKKWLNEGAAESAVGIWGNKIRFAQSDEELFTLAAGMKAAQLTPEELSEIRPIYVNRKKELASEGGGA